MEEVIYLGRKQTLPGLLFTELDHNVMVAHGLCDSSAGGSVTISAFLVFSFFFFLFFFFALVFEEGRGEQDKYLKET